MSKVMIARTNPIPVGCVVTGVAAVEEGEERRWKGRQGTKTLSSRCRVYSAIYDVPQVLPLLSGTSTTCRERQTCVLVPGEPMRL